MRAIFDDNVCARIVQLVGEGLTVTDTCESVGISPKTGHNWASEGRRNPAGRYGKFAQDLDAARSGARLDLEGHEPGPIEREVGALIAGRALDTHGRIAAATGLALARKIDVLAESGNATAAMNMAAASRRLDDVLASLRLQPEDEVTRIGQRYVARHARMQAALDNGAVPDAA